MALNPDTDALDNENPQRSEWVNMKLCEIFMGDTRLTMMGSLAVSCIMAGFLYKTVPVHQLLIWLVLMNSLILFRYVVYSRYHNTMQGVLGPALQAFFKRYDIWWTLAGVVWGASSYLFFCKASNFEQLICGLILIGVSCFAVYAYSSRLQCYFSYANGMFIAVISVFVYELLIKKVGPSLGDSLGLILLTIVFHFITRYFALRLHNLLHTSLVLQFDNEVLVKNLSAKSADALQAVENKNQFIASAAHDLRQPVHALNLYASWLVDEPQLCSQVAPQIVRCTNTVNELFNSLFAFSDLNIGSKHVVWQQINVADFLEDLRHQYAPLAQERGIELRLRKGRAPTQIRTDPVLLKRLLGNLISNALKNTAQGGVLLALRNRGGYWRIDVTDTGVGVDANHQQAIFQEFYRVPSQGTQEGFGLGLAISKRLSQLLELKINLRSTPGRGSTFSVESAAS